MIANAAGPYRAPTESYTSNSRLDFSPAEHHGDAAWDRLRLNSITQYLSSAWRDSYLK